MTFTQLLPKKEERMSPEFLAALGVFVLGLLTTAFGLYRSFRKDQIAELYRIIEERKKIHEADMLRVEAKLEKCENREDIWSAEKVVSMNLANRQDAEIRSLTSQVKSLTERLQAAGFDRRSAPSGP